MTVSLVIAFVGLLIFLAHLFSALFNRTQIPDVLLLILIGLFMGPIFGVVSPETFGAVGPVFVTIALVIILFESGIGLHIEVLLKSMRGSIILTLVNFLATLLMVTAIAKIFTSLEINQAMMLGAIVGGTSSAVVIPMIRQLQMRNECRTILLLESSLSDVLCIVVALGFLGASKLGEFHPGKIAWNIIASFLIAALLGMVAAVAWSFLLSKIRTLQNSIFTTPAFVFVLYGLVELLGFSGAIASLAFGVTIGNIDKVKLPFIKNYISTSQVALNEMEKIFFSEAVFLLKTFFFVYMGLSIHLTNLWTLSFGLIISILMFIIRIPVVWLSVPTKMIPVEDASLMAVMVPKGLAAAVLASIPLQQGIVGGELIQDLTFSIVLFTILITSILVFLTKRTSVKKLYYMIYSSYASVQPLPKDQKS